MRRSISLESIILSFICIADMVSTLILTSMGLAIEQNPLMAACLRCSPMAFVLVKTASFVPFVIVVERHRTRNPAFARAVTRTAIIVYSFLYVVLTVRANFA